MSGSLYYIIFGFHYVLEENSRRDPEEMRMQPVRFSFKAFNNATLFMTSCEQTGRRQQVNSKVMAATLLGYGVGPIENLTQPVQQSFRLIEVNLVPNMFFQIYYNSRKSRFKWA